MENAKQPAAAGWTGHLTSGTFNCLTVLFKLPRFETLWNRSVLQQTVFNHFHCHQ